VPQGCATQFWRVATIVGDAQSVAVFRLRILELTKAGV